MHESIKTPQSPVEVDRSFVADLYGGTPAAFESFRALFDASPVPLVITAELGDILDVNAAAESLSGFTSAQLRGRTVFDFRHYRDDADRRERLAALDGEPATGREFLFTTADGRELRLLAHTSRVTFAGRGCLLTAFTNVTGLARLDEGLLAAQRLEVAGKLSGGIAHEFNNLLTVMQGHLEALAEDAERDSAIAARIDALSRAVAQATRITSGLLTFSGHYPAAASTLDLNDALDGLRSLITGTLGETVAVTWRLDAHPATVRMASAHVAQIVLNLALNAREAMPDGGTLTIETSHVAPAADGARWVRLGIADSGHGMSEDVRRQAFDPFFTTKGPGRGTGLGLSICRGIAEQNGGRIEVASVVGRGTTVHFDLPLAVGTPERPSTARSAAPPRTASTRALAVLLVEDEADVRQIVAEILRRAGHTVHVAGSLSEAETLLDTAGAVDVLLTDLVMPGGSGFDVATRVRTRQPGVPVLNMSGYAEHVFAGGQRLDHLLQKPFTARTLLAALDAVVTT